MKGKFGKGIGLGLLTLAYVRIWHWMPKMESLRHVIHVYPHPLHFCLHRSVLANLWCLIMLDSQKNIHLQVFGEIAHFLIATTSKDVAGDIHYGDQVKLPKKRWQKKYQLIFTFFSFFVVVQRAIWSTNDLSNVFPLQACLERANSSGSISCKDRTEENCLLPNIANDCEWDYNGQGYQFQVMHLACLFMSRIHVHFESPDLGWK